MGLLPPTAVQKASIAVSGALSSSGFSTAIKRYAMHEKTPGKAKDF